MSQAVGQRWWVVGNSGSGKSSWAREIASRLGCEPVELDGLFHQRDWTPADPEQFRHGVSDVVQGDLWVIDGNYRAVRDLILRRVDVIFALEMSRWREMRQIVGRSLDRVVHRRELWNGNHEKWGDLLSLDPDRSVVRWSWVNHDTARQRHRWFEALASDGNFSVYVAHSHEEASRLLEEICPRPS